jgi:hypothetical protein
MNKGGFSWKRATGISSAKAQISRKIGIPLTKSGRQQKIGRAVTGGCLVTLFALIIPLISSGLVPRCLQRNFYTFANAREQIYPQIP